MCYHQPLLVTIMALGDPSHGDFHWHPTQADHASRETGLGIRMVMLLCHLWTKLRCMLWVLSQAKRGECLRVFFFSKDRLGIGTFGIPSWSGPKPRGWLVGRTGLMAHYGNMEPHSQPTSTTRVHILLSLLETPLLFAILWMEEILHHLGWLKPYK